MGSGSKNRPYVDLGEAANTAYRQPIGHPLAFFTQTARTYVEPVYMTVIYALALGGAFLAGRRFLVLAGLLLAYQTAAAMVFAGTARYRTPWDFLLALLAAVALERLWERRLRQ